jgi:dethiobiotin synthetase
MHGLFLTGTDTGVGKTVVTTAVARLLRQQGRAIQVCKPVATGAGWSNGRWVADDTVRLAEAAGLSDGWDVITPWSLPEPVAPPVAARLADVRLTLAALIGAVQRLDRRDSVVLVEGVGGLLCPLTEEHTVADLAAALGLPLVIVARRSLGTLNHTLLTLEAARYRGLKVAGVVVNETTPVRDLASQTNVAELEKRIDVPLLAVVPYQGESAVDASGALAGVDWWGLSQAGQPAAAAARS